MELLRVELSNSRIAWQQFAESPMCPPLVAHAVRSLGSRAWQFANVGRIIPGAGACLCVGRWPPDICEAAQQRSSVRTSRGAVKT